MQKHQDFAFYATSNVFLLKATKKKKKTTDLLKIQNLFAYSNFMKTFLFLRNSHEKQFINTTDEIKNFAFILFIFIFEKIRMTKNPMKIKLKKLVNSKRLMTFPNRFKIKIKIPKK